MRPREQLTRLDDHLANLAFKSTALCMDGDALHKLARQLQESIESELAYDFRCLVESAVQDET